MSDRFATQPVHLEENQRAVDRGHHQQRGLGTLRIERCAFQPRISFAVA